MIIRLLLSLTLMSGLLPAQSKAVSERHARFLAVGDLPPFRQEIRDGVRYEIEPPPGSIPPREVFLGLGTEQAAPIALRLGQPSAPIEIPPGTGPVILRRGSSSDAEAESWLTLTRPETGDFLVILWRDPAGKSWDRVKSFVLPDDPVAAPQGSVRYINLSPVPVGMEIGEEKILLAPGKPLLRKVPEGGEQPFQVFLANEGGSPKRLHSGVVVQNVGERSLVLVYRADGLSPRRPLKVAVRREPAPAAILPP